jgi:hypothetical protein
LGGSLLTLETPFHIARHAPSYFTWLHYEKENVDTQYIRGYAKSADGLVQRGILIRDSTDQRFWLTSFGIEYIKGLQS